MRTNRMESPIAVADLDLWLGNSLKWTLLGSVGCRRTILATAAMALLPSAQALAQCAGAPAAVSISSGNCVDPAFTDRTSAGTVVEVFGTGSYSATSTHLLVTGSGYGAYAGDSGTITLTGTPNDSTTLSEITTYGTGSHALFANGGGVIIGDNTAIYTNDGGAHGIVATGTGSKVTLTDSAVNTYGDGSYGAYVASGGMITLTRTDIQTYGAGASAVFVDAKGSIILNNVNTFSMGANNASGAIASGAESSLTLNSSYINVYSNDAVGLLAADGGTINLNGGAVVTGDYYGGTVIANSPGILARGTGSTIQVSNGATSATYGANSPGVWADAGGRIDFSGYGIFTYQPNSPGAQADGGSTVTLTDTIVRTSGPSSAGVLVRGGSTIIVTGTEITSGYRVTGGSPPVLQFPDAEIGLEAHGADVIGAGSRLQAENANITTNGDGAVGVRVSQGGTAVIIGGTIVTHGADTATVGGADGARAADAGSSIILTGTSVSTANVNAMGLHALAGGTIAATDVTVATQGQNSFGIQAQDAGSTITLTRAAITTAGDAATGIQANNSGNVQVTGGSVATTGSAAHGIAAINGGTLTTSGTVVAADGAGSAAIYLAGSAPSTISITGGSLRAASNAIVLAEGGTGTVSITGGTSITPALVNGRLLLARVTEDGVGNPANLTLNIAGMPALTGDVVVDPSTLAYNLSNSNWTGNLVLAGPGNTATATLDGSKWTGDLLADPSNTADVALTKGSLWTGLAQNATNVAIDANSAWNVTGDSNATGAVTNAGLIQFLSRSQGYTVLTAGNYIGNNGRIGFNTYLGSDNSPSNLLIINGGAATGNTALLIANTGGPGALTVADGIRLVQVTNGGSTAAGAFTLSQRVAAGAYEYQLFRGGSTDPNDWFLRSTLITDSSNPGQPPSPPSGPVIPLYRPEVALYAPIPAIGRQMGLATLGTLHERVGEQENIRALTGRGYANGGWVRVIGERTTNNWNGTVNSRATANLIGLQGGVDVIRTNPYAGGHRDHLGIYGAYTDYNAPSVSGFALGVQNLRVGRLSMTGSSLGAYWTHFGPSGWYVDAVLQHTWYDVKARSDYGTGLSTKATGFTASLETGYPIRFGDGNRWLIEPQAQIISQTMSVDRSGDAYSTVNWKAGNAWTGRLGARLQYSNQDAQGRLWQPYARINLWHSFAGNDGALFGPSSPIMETRFGGTSLEVGGGITVRVNKNLSFYGQGSYRWSLDGRSRQSPTLGTFGVRINW
ncbi:autotransporter outer membrane beta-barrel domain-containing protein [Methylocella sp. CPCC 101449]|uniref:autotransporter outer membrane beta-barrel domain-containing protein n=1 Tax=Methylocella sp. CPCC 101449 TaxID=2987531 RepID=UPI002892305E|nr:autotransporter outer membrane beta-barrel domain-containing protein [Methylocella sp. CPCC 101449]MDT2021211.1 autotransporter outer membrane beta-barrel domain-containing protein [Methylocella sp. CPCC 101449]